MDEHGVVEALRAAHAALDSITRRDEQALLEGRVCGLRLHAVAAADAANAADAVAAADTSSWAASAGRNRSRS